MRIDGRIWAHRRRFLRTFDIDLKISKEARKTGGGGEIRTFNGQSDHPRRMVRDAQRPISAGYWAMCPPPRKTRKAPRKSSATR
jgi:hypothetical protein